MPRKTSDTTRRKLLKTIGAAGLSVGATGVASADAPADLERLEAVHADPLRARWAAARHADPVLAELAERGVLQRGDVTELDFGDADVKGLYKDGTPVVQIETTTEFDDAEVEFVSRPGTGRVYATVRREDTTYTVERAAGSDGVTVQSCWYEHRCIQLSCSGNGGSYCLYQERHCCDNCTEEVGTSATCCGSWTYDGCCGC